MAPADSGPAPDVRDAARTDAAGADGGDGADAAADALDAPGDRSSDGAPDTRGDSTADASTDTLSGPQVSVVYQGMTTRVFLAGLPTVTLPSGTVAVTLGSVISAAVSSRPLAMLSITDLRASDGYSAAMRSTCVMARVFPYAAENAAMGFVNTTSRNLTWADSLGLPGCMTVAGLSDVALADR